MTSYITSKDSDCCTAASCSLAVLCDHLLDESAQKLLYVSMWAPLYISHYYTWFLLPMKGNVEVTMILEASALSIAT